MNLKKLAALFISAVVFAVFGITAFAEGELKINVDYDYYGMPFVSVTASAEGNVIRYTTDGSKPSFHSAPLDAGREFSVYVKTTVRAAEFTPDGTYVAGVKKTVSPKTAPVEFDFEYGTTDTVLRLTCATADVTIRYTTDGTKPDENSAIYTEPLRFKENTKVRACAYRDGYLSSGSYTAAVKISAGNAETAVKDRIKYKTDYISDKGIAYVTLTPQKNSNVIYYTADGSDPSTQSKKYSKRVKYTEPGVIRALEYTAKGEFVASLKLNVSPRVMPVQLSCVDCATGTRTIKLTTETPGATIYYTIDGSKPSEEYSDVYTAPFVVSNVAYIQAFAAKDGYKSSSVSVDLAAGVAMKLEEYDSSDPIYSEVQAYINDRRWASGLSTLRLDADLNYAANIRAKELSVELSHTRPTGQNYATIFAENGISLSFNMESYSTRAASSREFVIELLSQNEEANVLLTNKKEINSIGVGYYEKYGKKYWVLIAAKLE